MCFEFAYHSICVIITVIIYIIPRGSNAQFRGCDGNNRTTYLLSSGYELSGATELQNLNEYTLSQCREACDTGESCESFLHNDDTRRCTLLGSSAQPLGPGQLVQLADPQMNFYQKLCVPSPQLCDAIHSFERFPQRVLVGVTEEIVQATTLSDCLRSCVESMTVFHIQCKSAMYFYGTRECILNSIDQRQRPDLFSADTLGFIVDYFDNNCLGTVCPAPGIVQYVRTQDSQLRGGKTSELRGVDLSTCRYFCGVNQDGKGNGIVCNSYMFTPGNGVCLLSSLSSQPQGRTQLSSSPGVELYEKTCFSSPSTCGATAAYDRYPLSVLVGLSREVIRKSSLSQCLDACLDSQRNLGFVCLSTLFYYDTAECLLNSESRTTRVDLFSYDTKGARVDYFENLCGKSPTLCNSIDSLTFIRVSNAILPGLDSSMLLTGITPAECTQKCVTESNFVCRSVDVTADGCLLSYQNSDAHMLTYNPPDQSIYYQATCLQDTSSCGNQFYSFSLTMGKALRGSQMESISGISPQDCLSLCLATQSDPACLSLNYNKKKSMCQLNSRSCRTVGMQNLEDDKEFDYYENKCNKDPEDCEFPLVAQNMRVRPVFRMQKLKVNGQSDCEASCLASSQFKCRSFSFSSSNGACELSDIDQMDAQKEGVAILQDEIAYSFFQKKCQQPVEESEATVTPSCKADGIEITVRYPRPTNGAIFVRNKFSTCRTIFRGRIEATLNIPFPGTSSSTVSSNDPSYNTIQQIASDCDGKEIVPNVYMFVIVVEENAGVDVPGILTSEDRIFNVTCDYSDPFEESDPSASYPLGPRGSRDGQIEMQILRNDRPVNSVLLGETVQLKWKIRKPKPEGVGFFVKECVAERIGGNPPDPEPVKLITSGCPDPGIHSRLMRNPIVKVPDGFTTSMTVFRFDGSRSVRMRCVVEMCVQQCIPASCTMPTGRFASMGKRRKKRQMYAYYPDRTTIKPKYGLHFEPLEEAEIESKDSDDFNKNNILQMAEVSGSFTIVDRIPTQNTVNIYEDNYRTDFGMGFGSEKREADDSPLIMLEGQVCLIRPLFVGIFTFIGVLTVTESSVLFFYFYSRYKNHENLGESITGTHTETGTTPQSTATRFSSMYFVNPERSSSKSYVVPIRNRLKKMPAIEQRLSGAARLLRRRATYIYKKGERRKEKDTGTGMNSDSGTNPQSSPTMNVTTSESDHYPESLSYGRVSKVKLESLQGTMDSRQSRNIHNGFGSIKTRPCTNMTSSIASRTSRVVNNRLAVNVQTHNPPSDYSIPCKSAVSSIAKQRQIMQASVPTRPPPVLPKPKHPPVAIRDSPPFPPPPLWLSVSPGGSTLDGVKINDAASDDGSGTHLLNQHNSTLQYDITQNEIPETSNVETYSRGYRARELRNQKRMQSLFHEIKSMSSDVL